MKIKCNWCEAIFDENDVIYDEQLDLEICPNCRQSGCLMDITSDSPATTDDEKTEKPRIETKDTYLRYRLAAENMCLILNRERAMTCFFYVMDKQYYDDLAYPQFSADNRGHPLMVGDWYVIITCSNGYKYYVNVTGDSVVTMCAEVFGFIQCK